MRGILSALVLALALPVSAYEQEKDLSGAFYTNTAFGLCQVTGKNLTSLARQAALEAPSHKIVTERLADLDNRYAGHFDTLGFKLEDQEPKQGADAILELAAALSSGDMETDLLYKLLVWECVKETKIGLDSQQPHG